MRCSATGSLLFSAQSCGITAVFVASSAPLVTSGAETYKCTVRAHESLFLSEKEPPVRRAPRKLTIDARSDIVAPCASTIAVCQQAQADLKLDDLPSNCSTMSLLGVSQ